MKLRVWHAANDLNNPYYRTATNINNAKQLLNAYAEYDLFIGETPRTVRERKDAMQKIADKYNLGRLVLTAYDSYLADMNNGVPVCYFNAQGLEVYDEKENEWVEWLDNDDLSISEVMEQENFV